MKILQKIQEQQDKPFFSFEYFPPKTDDGVRNLFHRIDCMASLQPLFVDVTWGAGGSTSEKTLEICENAQKGVETMMHLTCTNMPIQQLHAAIERAKESGIQNILALRGDPPRGATSWKQMEGGFANAIDLVRYIREHWGDHFGITVAGYPEGHADATNKEEDLIHLKEKVDAGADFIITQLFYDVDIYLEFINSCRAIGINKPIIPGIMPIHTYAGFTRMTQLSKTIVPKFILDALEPIKDNDEAVKEFGIDLAVSMCKKLLAAGIKGLHFYTLNLERSVTRILESLNFISLRTRPLPWKQSVQLRRSNENVRPVFWINRHKSYVLRTDTWDEFPNGRWGDSRSPAFGDLADYHLMALHQPSSVDMKKQWGENPQHLTDIFQVFTCYCKSEIEQLPWNDLPLSPESEAVRDNLIKINTHGFLTINSQPRVNGVPSTDPVFGWGDPIGFVFQKAYIEFFVSETNFKRLRSRIEGGDLPFLTYHAVNSKGEEAYTNTCGTNALTWGVFAGQQIKQPTVVDAGSFLAWKDEAFSLWKVWEKLYPDGSAAQQLIQSIREHWFLVNIVDNNFQTGNIFQLFDELITEDISSQTSQEKTELKN